jgi:site-specific recombinase XerD
MKQNTKHGNFNWIKEEFEHRLIVMRYSEETIRQQMRVFGWIVEFHEGYGEKNYSKAMGRRFIAEYQLQVDHVPKLFVCAQRVVRHIDEILENKQFMPRFNEPKPSGCPPHFIDWFEKYLEHLAKRGFSKSTITTRERYVGQLLGRLPATVLSLQKLTAADLYSTFAQAEWPDVSFSTARCFLRFLFENGATKADMSACVPNPRRPKPLPSIYSGDEVSRLLSSIDRTTNMGRRDYAFIMLAAHLGLRSSDIVNLSFEDIDHDTETIEIVQVKTEQPIKLVMNGDVGEAIDDYIKDGRPESSSEKIFLSSRAPYMPITAAAGYGIVRHYFSLAGISAQGRRRGPHALRSSFATALVRSDVPYAVVQKALGHEDPDSAKHYVRVDVRRLRVCALDVPRATGALAVLLNDLEGAL